MVGFGREDIFITLTYSLTEIYIIGGYLLLETTDLEEADVLQLFLLRCFQIQMEPHQPLAEGLSGKTC